jgi:hypothetical protein
VQVVLKYGIEFPRKAFATNPGTCRSASAALGAEEKGRVLRMAEAIRVK